MSASANPFVTSPRPLDSTPDPARDVAFYGDHAVIALGGELGIADLRDPDVPVLVARVPLGLAVYRVLVAGNRAYAAGHGAVWIVDLEDPTEPAVLGSLALHRTAVDLAYTGDRLFVIELRPEGHDLHDAALRVVDVKDPTRPRDLGRAEGIYTDVDADEGQVVAVRRAWLGGPSTLEHFDAELMPLQQPTSRLGRIVEGSAVGVAISGDTVYALFDSEPARLVALDIASPAAPAVLGQEALPFRLGYHRIVANGSRVVIGEGRQLLVGDVALGDPVRIEWLRRVQIAPQPAAFIDWSSVWHGAAMRGNSVAVASDFGVSTFEVRNGVPLKQGHLDTARPIGPLGLALDGHDAYVADVNGALLRVDTSDATSLVVKDRTVPGFGQALDVAASGGRVFAAFWGPVGPIEDNRFGATLAEFDRTSPGLPVQATASFTGGISSLVAVGDRVYAAGSSVGVAIVDAPPGAPIAPRGLLPAASGRVMDLAIDGNRAYIADSDRGLVVADVGDPDAPRELGVVPLPGRARQVEVVSGQAFVAWIDPNDGRWMVGVSDASGSAMPGPITPLGLEIASFHVAASGACLYGVVGGALRVYDIRRPARPRSIDRIPNLSIGYLTSSTGLVVGASTDLGVVAVSHECAGRLRASERVLLPFALP